MKKTIRLSASIVFVFLAWFSSAPAQRISGPFVVKPVYFDVSPPLQVIYNSVSTKKELPKTDEQEREIWNNIVWKSKQNNFRSNSDKSYFQRDFGKIRADSMIRNFDGTPNVTPALPPDTYGEAGLNHYVHMVNLAFTVFSKTGSILLGPMNTSYIWNGLPHAGNSGDGTVMYDEQADRWFITNFYMPNYPLAPYYILIGVSQTSDPTGSWYRWEYQMDNIPDYPKFGIWTNSYFMTINRWFSENNYDGIGAAAFDREAMLAGEPSPAMVLFKFIHNQTVFCMLPADCDGTFPGADTPGFLGYLDKDFIGLYEFRVDWTQPANASLGNIQKVGISPYNGTLQGIPQKGSDVLLDSRPGTMLCRLQFRKFNDHQSMVVNQSIKVGNHHYGIRWYEMRRNAGDWFLYQESTYCPDSNSRWMGSIAMDADGNMALGYSVSGYNLYPSIRFTGRMKNDPLNQMTIAEQSIIEGGGAQTHPASQYARWGDYSSMTVDPAQPSTFWYTQQYYPETADYNWHTRIGVFSFANILSVDAYAVYPTLCRGQQDPLDVDVSGGTGIYSYSWTSVPAGFTSTMKNPLVSPDSATRYIVNVTSGNQTRSDTVDVDILPLPDVFAGADTTVCRYLTAIPLSGSADNYVSSRWFTSGDGSFSDPSSLITTYLTGPNDRGKALIDLELVVYPQPSCPVLSDHKFIRVDTCLGVPLIQPDRLLPEIYPNPGPGIFHLSLPPGVLRIRISDMPGRIVYSEDLEDGKATDLKIDLSGKPGGMYCIQLISKDRIITQMLILQ